MNPALIRRYLQQETSSEENELMQQWIEENGSQWLDGYFDQEMKQPTLQTIAAEKEAMALRVLAAVQTQPQPAPATLRTLRRRLLPWVAAACLLLAIALIWQPFRQAAPTPLSWQTFSNDKAGSIKKIWLPDSSLVILNAYSSISIANNYNDTSRELQLSGEAYFDVRHNREAPFIISAAGTSTRVYGTAFNISAYPEADQVRIALQRGSIGLSAAAFPEQRLSPGDLFFYDKKNGTTQKYQLAVTDIGNWTTGMLSFYKTPLRDVLATLEKKYDVKFIYDQALAEQTITASFGNVPLNKVLQHLSFVWNLRFTRKEKTIYIQ